MGRPSAASEFADLSGPCVLSAGEPPGREDRLLLRLSLVDGIGQKSSTCRYPRPGTPSDLGVARLAPAVAPRQPSRPATLGELGPPPADQFRPVDGQPDLNDPGQQIQYAGRVAVYGWPVSMQTSRARTIRRPLPGSIVAAAAGRQTPVCGAANGNRSVPARIPAPLEEPGQYPELEVVHDGSDTVAEPPTTMGTTARSAVGDRVPARRLVGHR